MIFHRDDQGYLHWLVSQPDGFVLSCEPPACAAYIGPASGPLFEHQRGAGDGVTTGLAPGGDKGTLAYQNVCALTRVDPEDWERRGTRAAPSSCGLHQPKEGR